MVLSVYYINRNEEKIINRWPDLISSSPAVIWQMNKITSKERWWGFNKIAWVGGYNSDVLPQWLTEIISLLTL